MPWKECQPVDERLPFVARLLGWDRVCIDASHVQAKRGRHDGPSPVNCGKPGAKHHLIVDGSGSPLAHSTTPGNRHCQSALAAAQIGQRRTR